MFRFHAAPLLGAALLGQLTALPTGDADVCDATTSECQADAGDTMSALQLQLGGGEDKGSLGGKGGKGSKSGKGSGGDKGGKGGSTTTTKPTGALHKNDELEAKDQQTYDQTGKMPGYEKYWVLVNASNIGEELPYSKADSNIPSCLQGLFYMDQQCLTYADMPPKDKRYPCLGQTYPYAWVNEYVTAFGNWDAKTKCFTAERKAWTFGQFNISSYVCSGYGIRACQTNADRYGPCDVGAKFGSTNLGDGHWDQWNFIKTSTPNGWLRQTPYSVPKWTYYAVQQVVDGDGNKTKWFQNYLDEAMQLSCPWNAKSYGGPLGCRRSEWASTGQIANCIHGTANPR